MRMMKLVGNTTLTAILSVFFDSTLGAGAAQTTALASGNTAFALELYGQLKGRPGNLFFSPYSISTALGMTWAGARGTTAEQMATILHFSGDQAQVHSSFGDLQSHLGEAGQKAGIELNIANALWAQKGHPFLPAFLEIANTDYQANLNQADFTTGAEAARGEINRWVAQKTKDRIQNILTPGSVDSLTRLVLANAVYFKGIWAKPFDKASTSTQTFHAAANSMMATPLMHHFNQVRYMENDEFQAVELPYKNGELVMLILLPRQVEGVGKLESQLTPALLSKALGQMKQQQVEIFLPRFTLESSFNLNSTLAKMGMPDAFSAKADFSGIDGTRQLFIAGVFHKAWGEVNEEGTEAAAATVITLPTRAVTKTPPPPPPVFRADHPFIFFIRHPQSGSLLFVGRFSTPGVASE